MDAHLEILGAVARLRQLQAKSHSNEGQTQSSGGGTQNGQATAGSVPSKEHSLKPGADTQGAVAGSAKSMIPEASSQLSSIAMLEQLGRLPSTTRPPVDTSAPAPSPASAPPTASGSAKCPYRPGTKEYSIHRFLEKANFTADLDTRLTCEVPAPTGGPSGVMKMNCVELHNFLATYTGHSFNIGGGGGGLDFSMGTSAHGSARVEEDIMRALGRAGHAAPASAVPSMDISALAPEPQPCSQATLSNNERQRTKKARVTGTWIEMPLMEKRPPTPDDNEIALLVKATEEACNSQNRTFM